MTTAHEFYEEHKSQKYEPLLKGVQGTYLFEIAGVGHWFISVRDGAIEFEEALGFSRASASPLPSSWKDADCTIRCDEADFIDIVEGRRNLITATMQGRVKVSGDYGLAQKFHGLISAKLEGRKEDRNKEAA